MADGRVRSKEQLPPKSHHQVQPSFSEQNGAVKSATEHTRKRGRTMTVEQIQRMVNEQLVNDLVRNLSSTRMPSSTKSSSSYQTGYDVAASSHSNFQTVMASSTNKDHMFDSAQKQKKRVSLWSFKVPRIGRIGGICKVHPGTANVP